MPVFPRARKPNKFGSVRLRSYSASTSLPHSTQFSDRARSQRRSRLVAPVNLPTRYQDHTTSCSCVNDIPSSSPRASDPSTVAYTVMRTVPCPITLITAAHLFLTQLRLPHPQVDGAAKRRRNSTPEWAASPTSRWGGLSQMLRRNDRMSSTHK